MAEQSRDDVRDARARRAWTRCRAGSRPTSTRISVQIEERPPRGEEDTYALFDGPALGDDPVGQLPPVITLFRRPLVEDFGHDPEELRREVQITVAHELAHLFGFDEDRLDELGYA